MSYYLSQKWGRNSVVTREITGAEDFAGVVGENVVGAIYGAIGTAAGSAIRFIGEGIQDARLRVVGDLIDRAMYETDAGNYTVAIDATNEAMQRYNGYDDKYFLIWLRGVVYLQWGLSCGEWQMMGEKMMLIDGAINDFNAAILQGGEEMDFLMSRAGAYVERGALAYALSDIVKCMQRDPNNPIHYILKNKVLCQLSDFDQALSTMEHAVHLSPSAATYFNRGMVHLLKESYDPAIADFSRAIMLNGLVAAYYQHRAEAHTAKGNTDAATADLATAQQLLASAVPRPANPNVPQSQAVPVSKPSVLHKFLHGDFEQSQTAPPLPAIDYSKSKPTANFGPLGEKPR
jgi:tetratricopeptide (TPR) repeat protein